MEEITAVETTAMDAPGTPESRIIPAAMPSYWRQLDIFNPEVFNIEVHVIGAGATGSWIAQFLGKAGVKVINVWDYDSVKLHNLPNSIYGLQDMDMLKVEALKRRVEADCGTVVIPHCEEVDGSQKLSGIVYLCTDTMPSRKAIWEGAIKHKMGVKLMVETRLGAELGIIHTVRPTNRKDVIGFEQTLFGEGEGEVSPCTYRAIITTVTATASLAAHKLVKFAAGMEFEPVVRVQEADAPAHSNYDMLCIRPIIITTCGWGEQ